MSIDQKTAYAVSDPGLDDYVCFWRERRYDQLECLKARYNKHEYAPHTHDTYVFGVILSGAESFTYRGVHHIAGSGRLVAMEPDEVHDGKPLDESYAYRCFYPSVALVQEVAGGLSDRSTSAVPRIAEAVMDDPALAERLARLHWMMEYHAPRLAVDTAFRRRTGDEASRFGPIETFDFSPFKTHCDVGGATGLLSIEIAEINDMKPVRVRGRTYRRPTNDS